MSALARNTDPATSHEASPADPDRDRMIALRRIGDAGPEGATQVEVDAAHLAEHPRAADGKMRKRVCELRRSGLVQKTGERRLTPRRRWAEVYRVTAKGRAALRAADRRKDVSA